MCRYKHVCGHDIVLLLMSIVSDKLLLYLFKNDTVKKYKPSYGAVKCPVWGLYALPILFITWSNTTVCPIFDTKSSDIIAWNVIARFFIWSASKRIYQIDLMYSVIRTSNSVNMIEIFANSTCYNTICVEPHNAQTNTNNVNKTCVLQTTTNNVKKDMCPPTNKHK
jgi:hypothetical protein